MVYWLVLKHTKHNSISATSKKRKILKRYQYYAHFSKYGCHYELRFLKSRFYSRISTLERFSCQICNDIFEELNDTWTISTQNSHDAFQSINSRVTYQIILIHTYMVFASLTLINNVYERVTLYTRVVLLLNCFVFKLNRHRLKLQLYRFYWFSIIARNKSYTLSISKFLPFMSLYFMQEEL